MFQLIQPPPDVLLNAIPPQVRDDWRSNPTDELIRRLKFLCACGPRPSDDMKAICLMHDRAVRAAWETYVYCAFACGFFQGQRGADLRGRLASKDPADFRSAMAECMVCWFLAGRLGLLVTGDAPGRGAKMLDMRAVIDSRDVGVEVKAPYRERPPQGQPWWGHDGNLIARSLDTANKQFADDVANILVLVPIEDSCLNVSYTACDGLIWAGEDHLPHRYKNRWAGRSGYHQIFPGRQARPAATVERRVGEAQRYARLHSG